MTQKEHYKLQKDIALKKEDGKYETYGETIARLQNIIEKEDDLSKLSDKEIELVRYYVKNVNNQQMDEYKLQQDGVVYTVKTKDGLLPKMYISGNDGVNTQIIISEYVDGEWVKTAIDEFYDKEFMKLGSTGTVGKEDRTIIISIETEIFAELFDTIGENPTLKTKYKEILNNKDTIIADGFVSISRSVTKRLA